jgi:hypothetical protein
MNAQYKNISLLHFVLFVTWIFTAFFATAQVNLDKVILREPLEDNAVRIDWSNKDKNFILQINALFAKKGDISITVTDVKGIESSITKNIFKSEIIENSKIVSNDKSLNLSFAMNERDLVRVVEIENATLDFNAKELDLFRGAWCELHYNIPKVFCVVRNLKGAIVAKIAVNYKELRKGPGLITTVKDGQYLTEDAEFIKLYEDAGIISPKK